MVVNIKEWDKIKEKVVVPGSVHEADQCQFVSLKVGNWKQDKYQLCPSIHGAGKKKLTRASLFTLNRKLARSLDIRSRGV